MDAEDALLGGSISHHSSISDVHPSDSPLFALNLDSEGPGWLKCDRARSQSLRMECRAIATRAFVEVAQKDVHRGSDRIVYRRRQENDKNR
jgi:hypothetical protein